MGQNIDLRSVIPSFHRRHGIVGAGFQAAGRDPIEKPDNRQINHVPIHCRLHGHESECKLPLRRIVGRGLRDRRFRRNPLPAHGNRPQPTLVFRYCDRACGECISFGADKLARELEGSNIPVVFLARYDNIQEMRRQGQRVNPWGFRMLNVEKILDLDEKLLPYYCIIDERGAVHDIFIPEKSRPSTTNQYLACIKDKYGNR